MRLHILALLALAACDGGDSSSSSSSALLCDGGADYDLSAEAADLTGLDGATVWVSAVEPAGDPGDDAVTVLLEGTVTDGGFTLSCGESLSYNMNYPSSAVIIDANGDGVCSDGDEMVVWQFYGWADHEAYTVTDSELQTISGDTTWGKRSVCDYYVPTELL